MACGQQAPRRHPTYGGWMKDDPSLRDEQLENEIRLVGDLVLAASQGEGRLTQEAIDEILGLDPPAAAGDGGPQRRRRRAEELRRYPATRHPGRGPSL